MGKTTNLTLAYSCKHRIDTRQGVGIELATEELRCFVLSIE